MCFLLATDIGVPGFDFIDDDDKGDGIHASTIMSALEKETTRRASKKVVDFMLTKYITLEGIWVETQVNLTLALWCRYCSIISDR
mmetsp:Transcript_474/g.1167  ORF Transcript_474/g.1167 Transcript_474/m.1167 type:complete len:85 (-) Transcript_474:22-276(-)